jgi:hypothetical protein
MRRNASTGRWVERFEKSIRSIDRQFGNSDAEAPTEALEASPPRITSDGSSVGALVLRIERSTNGQVVFTLSGRIQTEDIGQFQQLLVVETPGQPVMFDLRDVTLVNQDAVTFLADCEAKGIKLESCPLHIRNWIDQEKRRNKKRRRQKRATK